MQLELVPVWDSLVSQHRIHVTQDRRNDDYLVDAKVKVPGGLKGIVYRTTELPSLADVLDLVQSSEHPVNVSPRPYRLAQSCDGTIGSPVMALYASFCESKGLDPAAVMIDAYPGETWNAQDFIKSAEEAGWQGVAYPEEWDANAITGLVESLHEINYHQLACLIDEKCGPSVDEPSNEEMTPGAVDAPGHELMDVIRGYVRGDESRLNLLAAVSNESWWLCARQELQRRATHVLSAMDNQILEAIAGGSVDFRALCQKVAAELHQT